MRIRNERVSRSRYDARGCRFLRPSEDGIFVDVTLGGGGHAFEIASRLSSRGTFIGIDRDGEAIAEGKRSWDL